MAEIIKDIKESPKLRQRTPNKSSYCSPKVNIWLQTLVIPQFCL